MDSGLCNCDISKSLFSDCDIKQTLMSNVGFNDCRFFNVIFDQVNFPNADLRGCMFDNVKGHKVELFGAKVPLEEKDKGWWEETPEDRIFWQ